MQNFTDIIFIVNDNNNFNYNHKNPENNLIQLLKQKLMKNKKGIPFSCEFKKISSFGTKLQITKNTQNTLKNINYLKLKSPYDIKIDNNLQLIFIADYGNYRIVVTDLNGNYFFHFKTPHHIKPESLFIDQLEDRLLICCDTGIYSCNKKGENLIKIYSKGRLFAVTMDPITKYIYASDISLNKIIVIDLNGNLQFEITESGFNKPYALTFNSKRELIVSDTQNNRILKFNCNGQFIKEIKGSFNINWGISVDLTNDNILFVEVFNNQLIVLDCNGKLINVHKEVELKNPLQLDYCNVNGCVYVCGEGSNNVVVFK